MLSASVSGSICESSDSFQLNVGSALAMVPKIFYFEDHFVCLPADLDSYQWGYDDVTSLLPTSLAGEINQDYININPDYTHKYYWVNTAYGGCNQKTYYNAPLTIQNANFVAETRMDIYPNPTDNLLNVAISRSTKGDMHIDIVDVSGREVSSMHTSSNKFSIDVSNLTPGFYVINCYHRGAKVVFAKFVKE